MIALRLALVFLLVGVNAFFAAAQYSLLTIRRTRVRELLEEGVPGAKPLQSLLAEIERAVTAAQLGVTVASLTLGFIGQMTLTNLVLRILGWLPGEPAAVVLQIVSLSLAFFGLVLMHAVFGQLIPRALSLYNTERIALAIARPFHFYVLMFGWAIRIFGSLASRVAWLLGAQSPEQVARAEWREEFKAQLEEARLRGHLREEVRALIERALDLAGLQVREFMVARPDMQAVPSSASWSEVLSMFVATRRSRLPVYEGTLDHILGFVHVKDILRLQFDRDSRFPQAKPLLPFELRRIVRKIAFVPETKPAAELLREFRATSSSIAVVVDEFGSILGLVTLEDVFEQIVGEIHDEFDAVEHPLALADGAMIFDASINVRDLETQYGIELPDDPGYETIGGFVLTQLGFLPQGGETFDFNGFRFSVVEMDKRRIARVRIQPLSPSPSPVAPSPSEPSPETAPPHAKGAPQT